MKQLLGKLRSLFGGGSDPLLTPDEFTRDVAALLRKKRPDLEVEIVGEMEIKIGGSFRSFLNNAYDLYRRDPAGKKQIINDVLATGLEAIERSGQQVKREQIVPVIKDRAWLEESRMAMAERGGEAIPDPVHEEYNPELLICYAEDSERGIRYLQDKDLEEAGIAREGLRELAVANLNRLLATVKCQGVEGLYMMTADGTYEASLILFDEIWSDGKLQVQGETVVAIPCRDLLLVTGSENAEGLAKLAEIAAETVENDAPYRLTSTLFVHRGGKFVALC